MNFDDAAAYATRHGLEALLISRNGATLFERYADSFAATTPHALYSGTKSFWGPLAIAAQEDGLLDLDETVGSTFASWNDGAKARVTLHELLTLTSGIGFGGLGNAVPIYESALAVDLKDPPGTTFTYGGIPLQVFGAVLARKLEPQMQTPHAYLRARLLDPIGMAVDRWRVLRDGTQPLPTGAFVSAAEWSKYGRFLLDGGVFGSQCIVAARGLGQCFEGSLVNPRYGLGWWLADPAAEDGVVYASGAGGQAMYLVRSERLVVVKFGRSNSWRHETFLRRLLGSRGTSARRNG